MKMWIRQLQNTPETLGIVLRVLSGVSFAIMSGLIKLLSDSVTLGQIVFFRSAFALIPLVLFLIWMGDFPKGLKTQYPMGHVMRCGFGIVAMFAAFGTLRYLPIAEATAISYLSPVIVVVLATFWLKESVSSRRWLGVVFGMFGLAVMTVPGFSAHADARTLLGVGLGVASAILIAAALLQVRQLSKMGENSGAIAFYFAITGTLVGALTGVSGWQGLSVFQWECLIGIGLIGGIAQILMTMSFKYAEASAMAPYEYLSILWAVLMGMAFFDEVPSAFFWLAVPLILLGAIVAKPRPMNEKSIK